MISSEKKLLTNFQRKKLLKKASKLLDDAEYHIDQILLSAHEAEARRVKHRR